MYETRFLYQPRAEPVIGGPEDLGQLLIPKWLPGFPDRLYPVAPKTFAFPSYFFGMQFTGDSEVIQIDRWIPTYPDTVIITYAMGPDGMEPQGMSG